jgi:hypothetical protein
MLGLRGDTQLNPDNRPEEETMNRFKILYASLTFVSLLAPFSFVGPSNAAGVRAFALVKKDGTLVSGAQAVSSKRLGPGNYTVRFSIDVSACVYSADVQGATPGTDPNGGGVRSFNLGGKGRTVSVKTTNQGFPLDRDFSIIVVC